MKYNGKHIDIVYTAFPEITRGKIHGVTKESADSFLILIDNTGCRLQQYHALGHELAHVYMDHFTSGRPLAEIEEEANGKAWDYYRAYKSGSLATIS